MIRLITFALQPLFLWLIDHLTLLGLYYIPYLMKWVEQELAAALMLVFPLTFAVLVLM